LVQWLAGQDGPQVVVGDAETDARSPGHEGILRDGDVGFEAV
jgi:hypothetical protein